MSASPLPDLDALTPGARRILDVAGRLFYERGIAAVGVDTIAAESGVTKRTLYDRFGSKDVLVACYLAERDRRWRAMVQEHLARLVGRPRERVLAPFDALDAWVGASPRGCALVNALAELPDPEHPARRLALDEKAWLREVFADLLGEAGVADSRRPVLAAQLYCLHEGALTASGTAPDLPVLAAARDAARVLLEATVDAP